MPIEDVPLAQIEEVASRANVRCIEVLQWYEGTGTVTKCNLHTMGEAFDFPWMPLADHLCVKMRLLTVDFDLSQLPIGDSSPCEMHIVFRFVEDAPGTIALLNRLPSNVSRLLVELQFADEDPRTNDDDSLVPLYLKETCGTGKAVAEWCRGSGKDFTAKLVISISYCGDVDTEEAARDFSRELGVELTHGEGGIWGGGVWRGRNGPLELEFELTKKYAVFPDLA
jgi:hypothetical protein